MFIPISNKLSFVIFQHCLFDSRLCLKFQNCIPKKKNERAKLCVVIYLPTRVRTPAAFCHTQIKFTACALDTYTNSIQIPRFFLRVRSCVIFFGEKTCMTSICIKNLPFQESAEPGFCQSRLSCRSCFAETEQSSSFAFTVNVAVGTEGSCICLLIH